jgi:serine/threonine-protein kinase/endoribonuclease IRE1
VAIFDSSKKSWNVSYTEYVPNRLDWGIPVSSMPTDIYIAPDAGRAITGIDLSSGDLVWSLDLPYPVVSVFDVYHRQDFTVAVAKQEPPLSLSKGAIGDVLSVMDRSHGINTAYVGVHEGSLYALSINKYPLVQICDWASMYTGRKSSADNNRLIEKECVEDAWPGSWSETPHPLCCHGCDYHLDCLVGQHMVASVVPDKQNALSFSPFVPDISQNEPSRTLKRKPSPYQRALPREADENLRADFYNLKNDFTYDNLGKLWKSYFISTSVFAYMYRDRMKSFYELKMVPKWKQMLKKRARAKKAKARINAATRREREKIRREAEREREEEEEEEVQNRSEKRKSMENKRPAPLEKLTSAIIKRAERSKLVPELTKKIFNTGFDLERFKPSKSRVLHISDVVLGKVERERERERERECVCVCVYIFPQCYAV